MISIAGKSPRAVLMVRNGGKRFQLEDRTDGKNGRADPIMGIGDSPGGWHMDISGNAGVRHSLQE